MAATPKKQPRRGNSKPVNRRNRPARGEPRPSFDLDLLPFMGIGLTEFTTAPNGERTYIGDDWELEIDGDFSAAAIRDGTDNSKIVVTSDRLLKALPDQATVCIVLMLPPTAERLAEANRVLKPGGKVEIGEGVKPAAPAPRGTCPPRTFNKFLPFEQARAYVRSLNFPNRSAWENFCKQRLRPQTLPACPYQTYADEWKGWRDWLGSNTAVDRIKRRSM